LLVQFHPTSPSKISYITLMATHGHVRDRPGQRIVGVSPQRNHSHSYKNIRAITKPARHVGSFVAGNHRIERENLDCRLTARQMEP
jgi:hypothetical protein